MAVGIGHLLTNFTKKPGNPKPDASSRTSMFLNPIAMRLSRCPTRLTIQHITDDFVFFCELLELMLQTLLRVEGRPTGLVSMQHTPLMTLRSSGMSRQPREVELFCQRELAARGRSGGVGRDANCVVLRDVLSPWFGPLEFPSADERV